MPFFQNPFPAEFVGSILVPDKLVSLSFYCKGNAGRSNELVNAHSLGPYDFTGNDANGNAKNVLNISFALDQDNYHSWNKISVALTAASNVSIETVVTELNANTTFASWFLAESTRTSVGSPKQLTIKTKEKRFQIKYYINNGQAETVLNFNKFAGIADLPLYLKRHSVDQVNNFNDCANILVPLFIEATAITAANPAVFTSTAHGLSDGDTIIVANADSQDYAAIEGSGTVANAAANTFDTSVDLSGDAIAGTYAQIYTPLDQLIIAAAVDFRGNSLGYSASDTKREYEFLEGKTGYLFKKMWHDDDSNIVKVIEYQAGSTVGDWGKRTIYQYGTTGSADLVPHYISEEPIVLTAADLFTPDWSEATATGAP